MDAYSAMHRELDKARNKHPYFAKSAQGALVIMAEEFGEIARGIYEGDLHQAKTEAAQLAACCIRFINEIHTITPGENND